MEDNVEELTTPSKRTRDKLLKIGEKIEHQGRKASSAKRKGSDWRTHAGAPGNKRCVSRSNRWTRYDHTQGNRCEEKRRIWNDFHHHLMWRADSLKNTLMLTWTWIWANSEREWRTGEPGVLWSKGLQRVRHDLATEQQFLRQQNCSRQTTNRGWVVLEASMMKIQTP